MNDESVGQTHKGRVMKPKEEYNPTISTAIKSRIGQAIDDTAGGIGNLDSQDLIKDIMKDVYQTLLDAEMEAHLGFSKHGTSPDGNHRNGYGKKTIKDNQGQIDINVPRDRDASFDPKVVKKRSSTGQHFGDKIISLYARGLSTREIEEHLYEIYGIDASSSFISNTTEKVMEQATVWQSRALDKVYPVVFMDGIRFNVRHEGKVIKKVVYIALGVDVSGKQDVLGLWMAISEGASFWMGVCNELKTRGVDDILIACVDGLKGLPEAIEAVFPKVNVQLCVVHQIRNSTKFLSWKHRKAFCADLKNVYNAPTLDAAKFALEQLDEKWGQQYPACVKPWKQNWDRITTFFDFPPELRTLIYTTNAIENLNAMLRKNTKSRKSFPNDQALFKLLFLNIRNFTKKWRSRHNWAIVYNQLSILFEDRLNSDSLF